MLKSATYRRERNLSRPKGNGDMQAAKRDDQREMEICKQQSDGNGDMQAAKRD